MRRRLKGREIEKGFIIGIRKSELEMRENEREREREKEIEREKER